MELLHSISFVKSFFLDIPLSQVLSTFIKDKVTDQLQIVPILGGIKARNDIAASDATSIDMIEKAFDGKKAKTSSVGHTGKGAPTGMVAELKA